MSYDKLINTLLAIPSAHKATKYISETHVIRATLRTYKFARRKYDPISILIHDGRPSYLERKFIKLAKKAGEPFPIKKIQLKLQPKRK